MSDEGRAQRTLYEQRAEPDAAVRGGRSSMAQMGVHEHHPRNPRTRAQVAHHLHDATLTQVAASLLVVHVTTRHPLGPRDA